MAMGILTQCHHQRHLLRRWYFTVLPQKQARWKKEHHSLLDLHQKKGTRKKRSNVLLCPSPCWILHGYSHWGKQAEMLWMHMSASWFFFQKCNIPLFLTLCMTANSSLCLPGSSATHLSKFFCLVLSSFSLGNTCHFLALISLGL